MEASQVQQTPQSRVGKVPITVPGGVEVKLDGQRVSIKGPKGALVRVLPDQVEVKLDGSILRVAAQEGSGRVGKQFQGMARALLAGMIEGAAKGYATSLDLIGVGYRAEVKGQVLTLALGLSHQVVFKLPDEIQARVETIDEAGIKKPRLHLTSYDKMVLGQTAARIRSFRPPEPYKGKGVRYTGERIREKAGKAGGGKGGGKASKAPKK